MRNVDPNEEPTPTTWLLGQSEGVRRWAESPERLPTRLTQDQGLLAKVALVSNEIYRSMIGLSAVRSGLAGAMEGKFLDVGAGGGMALAAETHRSAIAVVGLEIWEPAYALARANVAASGYSHRVQIRMQDVSQVDERNAYSLIWLPAPYLLPRAAPTAFDRLALALKPGGCLVIGCHSPKHDGESPHSQAVLRSSNQSWEPTALTQHLRSRAFCDIEMLPATDYVDLIIARRL